LHLPLLADVSSAEAARARHFRLQSQALTMMTTMTMTMITHWHGYRRWECSCRWLTTGTFRPMPQPLDAAAAPSRSLGHCRANRFYS
jgi:hypothetical protein